jgi:hypothetical protein
MIRQGLPKGSPSSSEDQMSAHELSGLLMLFVAGGLLVVGIVTGRMPALAASADRRSQPLLFWTMGAVFAVAAFVGALEAAGATA